MPKSKRNCRPANRSSSPRGLLRALQDKGIEEIAEIQYTDRKILAHEYSSGSRRRQRVTALGRRKSADVLFPEIGFLTNDSWALVRAMANGRGIPLLLLNHYGRRPSSMCGPSLKTLTTSTACRPAPPAPSRIISWPASPFRLDGPDHVALFAYDNHTFIVESYLPAACDVKVSTAPEFTQLRDLVTGAVTPVQPPPADSGFGRGRGRGPQAGERRAAFNIHLLPHSYSAFIAEK